MGQVTQLLCGEVNLTELDADGVEIIRPHHLQVEPGVCAHADVEQWLERTEHLADVPYLGRCGDVEWPVHLWMVGSAHGIVVPDARVAPEGEEKAATPWPECEHASHYSCRAVAEKKKPGVLGPHPAPAVSSREGVAGQYPSAVLKLAERAREAGWEVRQQYAKGNGVHGSTGRPLAVKESYALVFHSHPMTAHGAYAVYRGGSWASVNAAGRMLGGVMLLEQWLGSGGQAVLDIDQAWEQAHDD